MEGKRGGGGGRIGRYRYRGSEKGRKWDRKRWKTLKASERKWEGGGRWFRCKG